MSKLEKKLEAFNPEDHYKVCRDSSIEDEKANLVVKLRPEGVKLILEDYEFKYGTQITRPADVSEEELSQLSIDERDLHYLADHKFLQRYGEALLKPAREHPAREYRAAFIVGPGTGHNIPIIYMKENGKEGLLYANTLASHTKSAMNNLKEFGKRTGIPVYVVLQESQADIYICATYAIAFGKAATAKDHHQRYLTPDLLTRLHSRSIYMSSQGFYAARLPDEFLVTSQLSDFVSMHQENKGREIHKTETLPELRGRHSDVVTITSATKGTTTTKPVAAYARKKSRKYADIAEIRFYAQQLIRMTPELCTIEVLKQFRQQAKQVLRRQGTVSDISSRPGLDAFAQEFLTHLTKQAESGLALYAPVSSSSGDKSDAIPVEVEGKDEQLTGHDGDKTDAVPAKDHREKAKEDTSPEPDAFAQSVQEFVKAQELEAKKNALRKESLSARESKDIHSLLDDPYNSLSYSHKQSILSELLQIPQIDNIDDSLYPSEQSILSEILKIEKTFYHQILIEPPHITILDMYLLLYSIRCNNLEEIVSFYASNERSLFIPPRSMQQLSQPQQLPQTEELTGFQDSKVVGRRMPVILPGADRLLIWGQQPRAPQSPRSSSVVVTELPDSGITAVPNISSTSRPGLGD